MIGVMVIEAAAVRSDGLSSCREIELTDQKTNILKVNRIQIPYSSEVSTLSTLSAHLTQHPAI